MAKIDEGILEKLRKLMAHKDSAEEIGNQAEAEAFARKVAYLLNQHKLTEDDVKDHAERKNRISSDDVDFDTYGLGKKPRRVLWTERLGNVIAENYFCKMLVNPGSNTLSFAGRPMDREIAVFVFVTLARAAQKMAEKMHKKKELVRHLLDEPMDLRGFKDAFYLGFVEGIRDRLEEMRKSFQEENPGFALVLTRHDVAMKEWAVTNCFPAGPPPSGGGGNNLGYEAGKLFAREVPIATGVGGMKPQKRIG